MENAEKKTAFTVRVNAATKEKADEVAEKLGITLTAAINLFVEQFARDEALPFQPTTKPHVYTEAELDPAFVDMIEKRLRSTEKKPDLTEAQLAQLLDKQFEK